MKDEQKNNVEGPGKDAATSQSKEQNQDISGKSKKTKYLLIGAIGFFVFFFLLLGAILTGHLFLRQFRIQKNRPAISRNYNFFGQGGFGIRGWGDDQNRISGKVTAVSDKTFTVDQDGQSKNVQITDSTRFPLDSSTKVNIGDTVIVWGEKDQSGVIQATRIIVTQK